MVELGRKYTCYSCHTKFYDLGKPEPLCPGCGANQRDGSEAETFVSPSRRTGGEIADEPADEPAPDAADAEPAE